MEERFVNASKLLEDDGFLKELSQATNDEEVQAVFSKKGVELSIEDIENMCKESVMLHGKSEFSENDLENVSGGIILSATTVACFALGAGSIGFYTSYGYRAIKKIWR